MSWCSFDRCPSPCGCSGTCLSLVWIQERHLTCGAVSHHLQGLLRSTHTQLELPRGFSMALEPLLAFSTGVLGPRHPILGSIYHAIAHQAEVPPPNWCVHPDRPCCRWRER